MHWLRTIMVEKVPENLVDCIAQVKPLVNIPQMIKLIFVGMFTWAVFGWLILSPSRIGWYIHFSCCLLLPILNH